MTLVMLGDDRKENFDHLVVECTGVAEPREIRDNFVQMSLSDHMVNERLRLGNLVTVVDSTMFLEHYRSQEQIQDRPDLGDGMELLDRMGAETPASRPVVDLLVEQVEVADIIIMNKCDQLKGDQQEMLEKLLQTLNASAKIVPSTFGRVPLRKTLMPQTVHSDDAEDMIPA